MKQHPHHHYALAAVSVIAILSVVFLAGTAATPNDRNREIDQKIEQIRQQVGDASKEQSTVRQMQVQISTLQKQVSDLTARVTQLEAAQASQGAVTCGPGQMACDGACRDIQNEIKNCGGCNIMCSAGTTCVSGSCI